MANEVITSDGKGLAVVKRYTDMFAERGVWRQHWDETAKFVQPRKDTVYGQDVPGEKRANRLFDTHAINASNDLAAALHGMMINPSSIWFGLSTGDRKVDADDAVAKWLFDSTLKMHQVLNQSNFQVEIFETFRDLTSAGTSSLRMEEDEDEVIRFESEPIYDVIIWLDNKKRVVGVSRRYEFTLSQIFEEFGSMPATEKLKQAGVDSQKKFNIIQEVSPRSDIDRQKGFGSTAMPFRSIHVLQDTADVLRESGFEEFSYAVPRWTVMNKEKYGRSPAMMALAEIKMVNAIRKVQIQSAQLAMAPPLQVVDNGFLAPLNVKPFGTNYKRPGVKDAVETLFTGANVSIGVELVELSHRIIDKHFLIDKLITPEIDRATATEMIQRRDEKLRFLGPTLGRLDRELLKPIVNRTFGIMERRKLFDDMPEALLAFVDAQGGDFDLDIQYKSTIAQAQVISQSENITRAISATSIVMGAQPEVMDLIDGDKLLKKNWDIYSVDPEILRSPAEVEQMRKARQEQIEAAQQAEADAQQAQTVKALGDTNGQTGGGAQ